MPGAARLLLAVALAACVPGSAAAAAGPAGPPRGAAAAAPMPLAGPGWTWVPFEEARCDDGSATGLAASAGDGDGLIVYLDGGGACWDWETCVEKSASRHGPFGETEFRAREGRFSGSLFDRSDPGNPFRSWSFVFVPYCTGDVHSGVHRTTYVGARGERRILQHRGRSNALAFGARIAATFPRARRVVIAGSSGGGYGTLVNYDALRRLWPAAKGYLVDDAGPALRGLPHPALRSAWWAAWGTPAVLETFCPQCVADPGAVWSALSRRWPGDRIALLSSTRDATIRSYMRVDATRFERAVRDTVAEMARLPNVRTFVVDDESHTMLPAPDRFSSGGEGLREWLREMVADDPAWSSRP